MKPPPPLTKPAPVWALLVVLLFFSLQAEAVPLTLQEVAHGVYVHQGANEDFDGNYHGDIANIGFIVGRDAVAVIDTGGSYRVGLRLKEAIRQVTQLPILYVINTHVHPDHMFGNAAFSVEHSIFIGHEKLPGAMEQRQADYLRNLKNVLGSEAEKSEIIIPSKTVGSTLRIDLGNRVLQLTAWPTAHTNTDLTLFDINTKTLWTGDLLFIERTPSIDGDVQGWINVIGKLEEIEADLTIPGHGKVTRDKKGALDDERRYLDRLLQDVRSSIRNGEGMTRTMGSAAMSERTRWLLFDQVNPRNVNFIYPPLEWE